MKIIGSILMISAIVLSGLFWKSRTQSSKSSTAPKLSEAKASSQKGSSEPLTNPTPDTKATLTEESNQTEPPAKEYTEESPEELLALIEEKDVVNRLNDPATSEVERRELGQLMTVYQQKMEVQLRENMKELEEKLNAYTDDHAENVKTAIASARALRKGKE